LTFIKRQDIVNSKIICKKDKRGIRKVHGKVFVLTQVATYAPAGLTNPAAVRICQSEPSQGRLFFQQVATWVCIIFFY